MNQTARSEAPQSRGNRPLFIVIALAIVAALIGGVAYYRRAHPQRVLRIATGLRGGTFLPLGRVLAATFSHDVNGISVRAVESPGGEANVAMLQHHEADLALLSNNAAGGDGIRLIAPLYEETLQIVVRRAANIASPLDLRGKTVSIGPRQSGTEAIAQQILTHFGIDGSHISTRNLTLVEAEDQLISGQLDAVFIVGGMRTPVVDRLLHRSDMALLSLGDPSVSGSTLDGIRIDAPFLLVTVIPEHTYGDQPPSPVGTIAVKALLVARSDLDDDLVQDITQSLFANKVRLAQNELLLARLSERFDPADSPYPLHPGADRYYRRDDPSFVAKNSDLISLALTIGALVWSAGSALRAARQRRRKGRIESYYAQTRTAIAGRSAESSSESLREMRQQLEAIRSKAFEELAEERLDANESFTILLEYLRAEVAETDRLVGGTRQVAAA